MEASIGNENSEKCLIYSFGNYEKTLIRQNIKRYVQCSHNVLYVDTLFKIMTGLISMSNSID